MVCLVSDVWHVPFPVFLKESMKVTMNLKGFVIIKNKMNNVFFLFDLFVFILQQQCILIQLPYFAHH